MKKESPASQPVYEIFRTTAVPPLDGWLQAPAWRGAQWVERFLAMDTWQPGKPVAVAFLWDDTNLYVGLKIGEPQLGLIHAGTTAVREDDLIELYFDPAGSGHEHIVISINAVGNVVADRWWIDDPGWGTRHPIAVDTVRCAARLTGSGWQLELAIPFAALGVAAPATGQCWSGNVCRIDRLAYQWSFWAPTDPVEHSYDIFPQIRFSGHAVPSPTRSITRPTWPRQPRFPLRGFMYDTSRGSLVYRPDYWIDRFPWFKEQGFNTLLLYFENHLRYDRHHAFAPPGSWTLRDLATVQTAAAAHGIDVIPAQTALGHCPGILNHPQYRELAEAGSNGYQFCVAHPDSRRVLTEIFAELAATSQSPYISINADESAYLGLCPRCQAMFPGWSRGRIFRYHILPLYDVIRSHGKRMMMWDDMLWLYPDAVEDLPRDIVLLDWHYSLHRRYPSLDRWRACGFDVVACPGMYSVENAFWFADHGAERGALGVINTLWEEHSLPLGSRWQHFMATAWATHATTPASVDRWFAQAGEELFGPGGNRLGKSLAAQDNIGRNAYRTGAAAPTRLEWQAAVQIHDEARQLLASHRGSGVDRELLAEFVYARRLLALQTQTAWLAAQHGLDTPARSAIAAMAAELRHEGLARWEQQCTVPAQQPAFLERFTAVERILSDNSKPATKTT